MTPRDAAAALACLAAGACGSSVPAGPAAEAPPVVGWVLHDAGADGYRAWFPGPPTLTELPAAGGGVTHHAGFVDQSTTYLVQTFPPLPPCRTASPQACRQAALAGAVESLAAAGPIHHSALAGEPAYEVVMAGDGITPRAIQTPGEPMRLLMASVRGDQAHAEAFFAGIRLAR